MNVSDALAYDPADSDERASAAGLDDCADLDKALSHVARRDLPVLDVGASAGRVVQHLLARGCEDVHALRRSRDLGAMRERFATAVHIGRVSLHAGDLMTFEAPTPFHAIFWMLSGITDFWRDEQPVMILRLARMLDAGGSLVIDLPREQTLAHGYLLSEKELQSHCHRAGLSLAHRARYETSSGDSRRLFVARERAW